MGGCLQRKLNISSMNEVPSSDIHLAKLVPYYGSALGAVGKRLCREASTLTVWKLAIAK